jgi:hypothetical protein
MRVSMKSPTIVIIALLSFYILLADFFALSGNAQESSSKEVAVAFPALPTTTRQTEKHSIIPALAAHLPATIDSLESALPILNSDNSESDKARKIAIQTNAGDTLENKFLDDWPLNTLNFLLKKMALSSPRRDSLATLLRIELTYKPKISPFIENPVFRAGFDKIERDLYKRNMGYEKAVPLANLVSAASQLLSQLLPKSQPQLPRIDFIPSKAEVEALTIIWNQPLATNQHIYANMDSSVRITAEDLDFALIGLTNKGLLTRKLISPRNEFSLQTPIGGVGIEMSAQNRRNRVYQYQSQIDREDVLKFLNAALYQLNSGMRTQFQAAGDSLAVAKQLQERILGVIKNQQDEQQ